MRHERPIGSWPPTNGSTPSTRMVGEPRKPRRSASSDVVTSRRLSRKRSSDSRAVSRTSTIRAFGQLSKYSSSTFKLDPPESEGVRLERTLDLPVHRKVKGGVKMRIGEVATRAGVPAKTRRFWEGL